jgi:hypothetical protein
MFHNTRGLSVIFAGVGLFGASTICHAALVESPVINLAIPVNAPGLYLNIETGASGTSAAAVPGWDINIGGTSSLNFTSPGGYNFVRLNSAPGTAGPSNLPDQFDVSVNPAFMPTASWIAGGVANGLTLNSAANYIGFRFVASSGSTHVGFLTLSIGSSVTGADRKIVSYEYNSVPVSMPAGASIIAPAPGALALLCQAGFLSKRRRR